MHKRYKSRASLGKYKAFTIVELLVVIVVIGILAAITIVAYSSITRKANTTTVTSDLGNASRVLKLYSIDHGLYPSTLDENNCPETPTVDNKYCVKLSANDELVYYSGNDRNFTLQIRNTASDIVGYINANSQPVFGSAPFASALGGEEFEEGYSVITTSDGGFAITGETDSFGAGSSDMFITKYDSSGELSWTKTWGGEDYDGGSSLIQTSDGGFAVTGGTDSFGAGGSDMYLAKFSSVGALSWSKTWGGTGTDGGFSLVQTSDSGFVVTGQTNSFGAGNQDVFLTKFTSAGALSWSKTWGGTGIDNGDSVILTSDGGILVSGQTYSYSAGNADVILLKYNSSGTLSWSKTWGTVNWEYGSKLMQTTDGGFAVSFFGYNNTPNSGEAYIAKFTSDGTLTWNKTWGSTLTDTHNSAIQTVDGGYAIVGRTYSFGLGDSDMYIAKFTSAGVLSWSRVLGLEGWDEGYSVAQGSDEEYVVTGYTEYNDSNGDVLIAKLDVNGGLPNCSDSMCTSPIATVTTPAVSVVNRTGTVTSPSPTVTSPSPTVTGPTMQVITIVTK